MFQLVKSTKLHVLSHVVQRPARIFGCFCIAFLPIWLGIQGSLSGTGDTALVLDHRVVALNCHLELINGMELLGTKPGFPLDTETLGQVHAWHGEGTW